MRRAVIHSPATAGVPAAAYRLARVRVSSRDRRYGAALILPAFGHQIDPAAVLLRRIGRGWLAG
jgi:hypothetical protein